MKRKRAILFGWIVLVAISIITGTVSLFVSYPRVNYRILISGIVLGVIALILLWPKDYPFNSFSRKDKKVP